MLITKEKTYLLITGSEFSAASRAHRDHLRTVTDGEHRTTTTTFTQLLNSASQEVFIFYFIFVVDIYLFFKGVGGGILPSSALILCFCFPARHGGHSSEFSRRIASSSPPPPPFFFHNTLIG